MSQTHVEQEHRWQVTPQEILYVKSLVVNKTKGGPEEPPYSFLCFLCLFVARK